eukprot:s13_g9.t1
MKSVTFQSDLEDCSGGGVIRDVVARCAYGEAAGSVGNFSPTIVLPAILAMAFYNCLLMLRSPALFQLGLGLPVLACLFLWGEAFALATGSAAASSSSAPGEKKKRKRVDLSKFADLEAEEVGGSGEEEDEGIDEDQTCGEFIDDVGVKDSDAARSKLRKKINLDKELKD